MSVVYVKRNKPSFTNDQLVPASTAAKTFGKVRRQAKVNPQYITENGEVDTVLLDYKYYEEVYSRLMELEEAEEARVLSERIARLDSNPETAVSWKEIRRSE